MKMPFVSTDDYLTKEVENVLYHSEYAEIVSDYKALSAKPNFEQTASKLVKPVQQLLAGYDEACKRFSEGLHPADALKIYIDAFNGMRINKCDGQENNLKWLRDELRGNYSFTTDKEHNLEWYKDYWEQYDAAEQGLRRLWPVVRDEYLRQMDAMQKIDFDEMETRTLALLRSNEQIRNLWAEQIHALLVDEYQDTNDAQAELFSLLNPNHDRLFAVGDKKQSIYGFRGTNVALFDRRKEEVKASNGEEILLDTTYRTEAELLEPMGNLLEQVMADDALSGRDFYAAYEAMIRPSKKIHFPKISHASKFSSEPLRIRKMTRERKSLAGCLRSV